MTFTGSLDGTPIQRYTRPSNPPINIVSSDDNTLRLGSWVPWFVTPSGVNNVNSYSVRRYCGEFTSRETAAIQCIQHRSEYRKHQAESYLIPWMIKRTYPERKAPYSPESGFLFVLFSDYR